LAELGYLPKAGDILKTENWQYEVIELEGKRINKVIAKKSI
jgi:CBS domain containing-hemolysin-like protein